MKALLLAAALVLACNAKAETKHEAPQKDVAGGVAITVDGKGFTPSAVTLKKGGPGALVFTRTTDETCATEVVFPELDLKKPLPKNTPVTITIPTDKEQKLTFQCGMGMYKSAVVIGS